MSPRTKEQNEKIRAERKEAIMDAALHVFAEEGYHSASISKVSKVAGISKGLMYNYFESKEELLKGLLHTIIYKEELFMRDLLKKGLDETTFIELIDHTADLLSSDPKHWKLYFHMAIQPEVFAILMKDNNDLRSDCMQQMVAFFEAKHPGEGLNRLHFFNAAFSGIKMNYVLAPDNYPLHEMTKLLINQFIKK